MELRGVPHIFLDFTVKLLQRCQLLHEFNVWREPRNCSFKENSNSGERTRNPLGVQCRSSSANVHDFANGAARAHHTHPARCSHLEFLAPLSSIIG